MIGHRLEYNRRAIATVFACVIPPLAILLAMHTPAVDPREAIDIRLISPTAGIASLPALFATDRSAHADLSAEPGLAPTLVGVAGRLPYDAVALVRLLDGEVRQVRRGEMIDGWRLEGLDAQSVSFERGGERVRSTLPVEP